MTAARIVAACGREQTRAAVASVLADQPRWFAAGPVGEDAAAPGFIDQMAQAAAAFLVVEAGDGTADLAAIVAERSPGTRIVEYRPDDDTSVLTSELHRLDLISRLDEDPAARIEVIIAAGRERIAAQTRFVHASTAEQDDRVAELEGQGVVRAVRAAWSRRRRAGAR